MYYPGFDYVSETTARELREKHMVPVDEATLRDLIWMAGKRRPAQDAPDLAVRIDALCTCRERWDKLARR